MFLPQSLSCLLFVALVAVNASPVDRHNGEAALRFATRINKRGILNVVEADRARVQAMKQFGQLRERSPSFNVTNNIVNYVAEVGVGTPPTNYELLLDTGSANTWVGANKPYVRTKTSKKTGNSASVSYGSGSWSGEEWTDTVTLSPQLVVHNQSIGVANTSQGLYGLDGILGVGPNTLTAGTVVRTKVVPTVPDNLYAQRVIHEEVLGIYFIPASQSSTGKVTFGGYDKSVTTGTVNYVPLTTTEPASGYWGIDQSVAYGGEVILSTTAGIVDTGTTLVLLATDAFDKYQNATGGVLDSTTGLLTITSEQYANLQPLTFNIGSTVYQLTPNGQIWPRSLNAQIGGSSNAIYLVVGDIGSMSGSGFDFVNGYTFLERFYSIFDTTNRRVGFATTAYTLSTAN